MGTSTTYKGCKSLVCVDIEVKEQLDGCIASTTALHCGSTRWKYPEFEIWGSFQKLVNLSSSNVVKNRPSAHLQHMKVVKCLICVWNGSESHLNGCMVSTKTLWWGLPLRMYYPQFELTSQNRSLADLSNSNVVREHPYAHSEHMKVMKCYICIWYWGESKLERDYSFSQHTTMCLPINVYPTFEGNSKSLANLSIGEEEQYWW